MIKKFNFHIDKQGQKNFIVKNKNRNDLKTGGSFESIVSIGLVLIAEKINEIIDLVESKHGKTKRKKS